MRLKSAYRMKENIEPEIKSTVESDIPAPVDMPPEILVDEDSLQREPEAAPAAAQPESPKESEASAALRAHLDAMKRSEAIQAQRQAMAVAEQRRVDWLQNTPAAQQNYVALGPLHQQAMEMGLDDLSPEYFQHMEAGLAELEPPLEQPIEAQPMPKPERLA